MGGEACNQQVSSRFNSICNTKNCKKSQPIASFRTSNPKSYKFVWIHS